MNFRYKNNLLLISPEPGFGGSEKSFASLSVNLAKFYNVFIVFFNIDVNPVYSYGGKIISLNTKPSNNIFSSIRNLMIRFRRIKSIKKNLKINISISFLEGANYINVLTKNNENCILSVRGSKIHDLNIKGFHRFLRLKIFIPALYKKANNIVCISNGIKEELIKSFGLKPNKIIVIYNFIDHLEITAKSEEAIDKQFQKLFRNFVLISHNRLAVEKGLHFQLIILKKILINNPNIKLILIGEGPFKDDLIHWCRYLDLKYFEKGIMKDDPSKYHVIFWGYSSNPYNLLKNSNLFISTSPSEGFGNSLLEAMASKCMVISSDCPYGPKEIIFPEYNSAKPKKLIYPVYHKNGILMPIIKNKNDRDALKLWEDTLAEILNKNVLNFSYESAYQRVTQFSVELYVNSWLNLINK